MLKIMIGKDKTIKLVFKTLFLKYVGRIYVKICDVFENAKVSKIINYK
jgi:hypothetical protein